MKNQPHAHSIRNSTMNIAPIAIVGMSGRFPQAKNLQEFWNLLKNGKDAVTEIPKERWNVDDYYDADELAARKTNQRHAAMLSDIHHFDPFFFNISPTEAIEMNPSQKLMLELAWEAIESSSIPHKEIQGKKVGVYIGNIWSDFEHLRKHKYSPVTSHSAMGQSSNIIANRISFTFGFRGPSLVMDTGCSSSLVAIHLACQSIWEGSSEMAIAGAVNHILDPDQYILLTKFGGLSKSGKCRTFDKDADGFVRGEGAGILLLKPLADAERDGDKIYAVIRGTAMNNNGYNANLPATSVEGQKEVLADAYRMSGISPEEVHYVEAHGTGTRLGDPTESKALGEFFGKGRTDSTRLHVGSVKTNIGHLEGAAGIAGILKVVLAMNHKMLPPSINFNSPNPNIPFDELKLSVQNILGEWPTSNGETLKAGINSFGWGGTNAHAVIEEYRESKKDTTTEKQGSKERIILPISAKSEGALNDYVQGYKAALVNINSKEALNQFCAASAILKPSFDYRLAFSGENKEEIIQGIESFLDKTTEVTLGRKVQDADKIVFVFPGQGSQWLGMGRELYAREEIFKKSIEASDKAFGKYTDWSLIDQLHASADTSRLKEINVIQPMLCAVQIALAELWSSWGVTPDAVVGHSMGEVAAAYIAGAISLEDAAKVICTRSRLMKTVSGSGGAMAVTELTLVEAKEVVAQYEGKLSIAVSNSPKSTVLAGEQAAITEVLAELEKKDLFCKQVNVDVASHSPQMDPLKEPLREALKDVNPLVPHIPVYSTVKKEIIETAIMDKNYWVDNLRGTVEFAFTIEKLVNNKHTIFIEVSPHPVLTNAINECVEHLQSKSLVIPSIFREKPEQESLYKNLGELYAKGYELNWKKIYHQDIDKHIQLPAYPFQRERYEIEDKSAEQKSSRTLAHPLLGRLIQLADEENIYFWESELSIGDLPYLNDHQVNGSPVFPGAGYLEAALSACDNLWGKGSHTVEDFNFHKPIVFQDQTPVTVQLKITVNKNRSVSFKFFRKLQAADSWLLLAEGTAKNDSRQEDLESISYPSFDKFKEGKRVEGKAYYRELESLGLQYGPYFQGCEEMWISGGEVLMKLKPDARILQSTHHYKIHPAVADSAFHILFSNILDDQKILSEKTTFLTSVGSFRLLNDYNLSDDLWVHAKMHESVYDDKKGTIEVGADFLLFTPGGKPILKVIGLKGKILDTSVAQDRSSLRNWLYKTSWMEQPVSGSKKSNSGCWLILGDISGISLPLSEKFKSEGIDFINVSYSGHYAEAKSKSWDQYSIHFEINYADPEHYQRLFSSVIEKEKKEIKGIIHCSSIYTHWAVSEITSDEIEALQKLGSLSLNYLFQSLSSFKLAKLPKVVVVTSGVQVVGGEVVPANVVHAPLWGLTKVAANELSQYTCQHFDLSYESSIEEIEVLFKEVLRIDSKDNEMAIRGKKLYVSRLDNYYEDINEGDEPEFSPDHTYLVTGFRGLGFAYIEWMFERGARNFALISRSGYIPNPITERIKILEESGAKFRVNEADVSDFNRLKEVINDIEAHMPPLRGVIHAAGLIEAKPILEHNEESFIRILAPKVKGAWNLHMLTQDKPLDCFVLFSSASSLIGLSGQSSYVAANSFLDTLAHHRRRKGLPAMSINWGVIKDVGMVADSPELEKYAEAEGFEAVTIKDALEVFSKVYKLNHVQIGIMKLDFERCASYYSALAQTGYLSNLFNSGQQGQQEGDFMEELVAAATKEEQVKIIEQHLLNQVAKIIKASTSAINNSMTFKGLGIDSLMAIQLRNKLEKSLKCKLSVTSFWMHPTIREYTLMLYDMSKNNFESSKSSQPDAPQWFVIPRPNPKATMRLFCFHDAGGSSVLYQGWENYLDSRIELVCIELPGRGKRINEAPYADMGKLVKDLTTKISEKKDKPFAFFGHSMGGGVQYEVTQELRRQGLALPVMMFVSSTPYLGSYKSEEFNILEETELVKRFPHISRERIADPEFQQLLLKMLQNDLQVLRTYKYSSFQSPMDIPVVVLYGSDDEKVREENVTGWKDETTKSSTILVRSGGHRYIEHDAPFLGQMITLKLSAFISISSENLIV